MKRSRRLDRIVHLSSAAERRAALAIARAESELQNLEAQRNDLRRYQTDYLQRLTAGDHACVAGYEAQKLRVFVQRIETAIAGIDQKSALMRKRLARERDLWATQQRRLTVVSEIAVRVRGDESRATEASLQREIDDLGRSKREFQCV
ncbi:MAG: hypothetical protein EXR86_01000 [Gammaproteobacteria bacterium]|nr:hypothetical protein [Gammaproteobacteria bacterium]